MNIVIGIKKAIKGLSYWIHCLNPFAKTILPEIYPFNIKLFAYKADGVGRCIFKTGVHEPHITNWLKNAHYLNSGNFIDIGANIGYYSLIFSKLAGSKGVVLSFEPERDNLSLLKKNLLYNHCNNVKIYDCALADVVGKANLSLYKPCNRGRHSLLALDVNQGYQEIDCKRLDDILSSPDLNEMEFDLLKIDIEGYEYFALRGAKNSLKKIKRIILEYSPTLMLQGSNKQNPKELLDFLSQTHPYIYEFIDDKLKIVSKAEVLKNETQRDLFFCKNNLDIV